MNKEREGKRIVKLSGFQNDHIVHVVSVNAVHVYIIFSNTCSMHNVYL